MEHALWSDSGHAIVWSVTRPTKTRAHMKKLALTTALLLATSPVAAQSPQQALSGTGTTNSSPLPNTGITCQEEMTATFCNVPTSPNTSGYGSSRATGSSGASASSAASGSSGGAGTSTSSIHPCPEFPPANELCN
jgi:hypothetical protein